MRQNYFSNADLVWCVYKNTPNGSSGVFHLSNIYKKPVATNINGLVGWYNLKNNLGPILNFNNSKEYINSVKKILNLSKKKNFFLIIVKSTKIHELYAKTKKILSTCKEINDNLNSKI